MGNHIRKQPRSAIMAWMVQATVKLVDRINTAGSIELKGRLLAWLKAIIVFVSCDLQSSARRYPSEAAKAVAPKPWRRPTGSASSGIPLPSNRHRPAV